jgi:hypothetical protein
MSATTIFEASTDIRTAPRIAAAFTHVKKSGSVADKLAAILGAFFSRTSDFSRQRPRGFRLCCASSLAMLPDRYVFTGPWLAQHLCYELAEIARMASRKIDTHADANFAIIPILPKVTRSLGRAEFWGPWRVFCPVLKHI